MKKCLLIALFLLFCSIAHPKGTLKERLVKSTPGDYIVTEQGNAYSLLLVRSIDKKRLVLEEISIERSKVDLKKLSWKNWVEKKAPGAGSWTAMCIDLEKNTLSQCFSYLENQWLFIDKSDYFLGQLFTLQLKPTRDNERKRIGPAPMPGEIDRRKLWKPQHVLEGKKNKKAEYEVLRSTWPSDKTKLAGCIIELYLDASRPDFPFPYWMEVQSPHYTFKLRTIDSGSGMKSPMRSLK